MRFGMLAFMLLAMGIFDDNQSMAQDDPSAPAEKHAADRANPAPGDIENGARGLGAAGEERIAKALAKPATFDFSETPLTDVLAFVRDKFDIEIHLDRRALDEIGIPEDAPVTLHLKHVSLGSALRHALHPFDLTFTVECGILLVTTPGAVENQFDLRVFPVADLVYSKSASGERRDHSDDLVEMITFAICFNCWDEVGGPGRLEIYDGALIVSQTRDVHDLVENFLAMLRKLPSPEEQRAGKISPPRLAVAPVPAAEERIRQELERATRFEFNETPLADVAEFLETHHKIDIMIDTKALNDVGIDAALQITANIDGVKLKDALRLVLREFDLTYLIQDEVLLITTPEVHENAPRTMIYPVGDLLSVSPDVDDSQISNEFDELINVITSHAQTNSWDEVGGPGSLRPWIKGTALVVSQVEDVHDAIASLLARLRTARRQMKEDGTLPEPTPPQMKLRVFSIPKPADNDGPQPTSDDLKEVVEDLIEPAAWQEEGAYIKAVPGKLLVRHHEHVLRKVDDLMTRLFGMPSAAGF